MPRPRPTRQPDPPTVAQVRAIRRRMLKEAGGSVEALMALAKKEIAKRPKPSPGRTRLKPKRAA